MDQLWNRTIDFLKFISFTHFQLKPWTVTPHTMNLPLKKHNRKHNKSKWVSCVSPYTYFGDSDHTQGHKSVIKLERRCFDTFLCKRRRKEQTIFAPQSGERDGHDATSRCLDTFYGDEDTFRPPVGGSGSTPPGLICICCSTKREHLQYIYTHIYILLKSCNLKSSGFLNAHGYSSEYYFNI